MSLGESQMVRDDLTRWRTLCTDSVVDGDGIVADGRIGAWHEGAGVDLRNELQESSEFQDIECDVDGLFM